MTLQEMFEELADNLRLAQTDPIPSNQRMARLLNRAKDDVVGLLTQTNEHFFGTSKTYAVAANTASVALPSTPDATLRRVVSLHEVDANGTESQITVIDIREKDTPTPYLRAVTPDIEPFRIYLHGNSLYFVPVPARALSLLLRYIGNVADLAFTAGASSFSLIPSEYHSLIVDRATMAAMPASSPEFGKVAARYADGAARITINTSNRSGMPNRIRRV